MMNNVDYEKELQRQGPPELPRINGEEKPRIDQFHSIHEEFRPRILRYLTRMVGKADAEDLTQEVFIKVGSGLPGFRGESSLSTWIYRIAMNTALDLLRSNAVQPAVQQEHPEEENLTDHPAPVQKKEVHLPDTLLIRKDMNDCIRSIVYSLPEQFRTVLVLSDLEEMTNAEISRVLGLSIDAVKMRLHRARAMLRKEMDKKCVFYRDGRSGLACDRKSIQIKGLAK